jgi:hypothetical protein
LETSGHSFSRRWKFLALVFQTLENGGPGDGGNVAAFATAAASRRRKRAGQLL